MALSPYQGMRRDQQAGRRDQGAMGAEAATVKQPAMAARARPPVMAAASSPMTNQVRQSRTQAIANRPVFRSRNAPQMQPQAPGGPPPGPVQAASAGAPPTTAGGAQQGGAPTGGAEQAMLDALRARPRGNQPLQVGPQFGGELNAPPVQQNLGDYNIPPPTFGGGPGEQPQDNNQQSTPGDARSALEAWILAQLTGGTDTSAEEALAAELNRAATSQAAIDAQAGMGAMGFAGSGAAGTLAGDIQRQGSRDLQSEIFDIRRNASNEAFDRAMAGGQLYLGLTKEDRAQQAFDQVQALMEEIFGPEGEFVDENQDGLDDNTGAPAPDPSRNQSGWEALLGSLTGTVDTFTGQRTHLGSSAELPPGSTWVGENGAFDEYRDANGNSYFVPRGA